VRYPTGRWILGARLHQLVEHRRSGAGAGTLQDLNASLAPGSRDARKFCQDPWVRLSDVLSYLDLPPSAGGSAEARCRPVAVLCSALRSLGGTFRSESRVPTHLLGPTAGSLEYLLKTLGRAMCVDAKGLAARRKVQVLAVLNPNPSTPNPSSSTFEP